MKKTIILFTTLLLSLFSFSAKEDILRTWLNEAKTGIVEFREENDKIVGYLIDLKEKFDANGNEKLDFRNPNKELQSRKIKGLKIIENFKYNEANNSYEDGKIYDPSSGKTYYASASLKDGKLHLRGSIDKLGWFGVTQTWEKIEKNEFESK